MKSIFKVFTKYFRGYGGWRGLFSSPFFYISVFLTVLSNQMWLTSMSEEPEWISLSRDMIPDLLGFSLGAYALLFSLNERVRRAMSDVNNNRDVSYLDNVNSIFLHFIFVQFIAVSWSFVFDYSDLFALIIANFPFSAVIFTYVGLYFIGSFFGAFLVFYSISLIVAAAFAVFRLASLRY